MGMSGMMPTGPSKEEAEAASRMVRLESWASMVMHTMVSKRDFSLVTETQLEEDPSPYTKWVAKLAFSTAAAMEDERSKLVRNSNAEGQDYQ